MESGIFSKYIPVYLNTLAFVPTCLRGIAKKVPDDFHGIIERLHDIPRYQLNIPGLQRPVRNEISIDSNLLRNLKLSASCWAQHTHPRCDVDSCSKVKLLAKKYEISATSDNI